MDLAKQVTTYSHNTILGVNIKNTLWSTGYKIELEHVM